MQINSINTNLAAYAAQSNIRTATDMTSKSVARLSSGNRIIQAADDVAGLAVGTSLATNVRTLRTALTNTSQAVSLLQVADAALNQVTEILQRQKAIAVQAGAGTLGATERSFLNAEFTALTSEIDRIADNTNFNGVKLINGGLSQLADVASAETAATAGDLQLSFLNNFTAGEVVVIGGVAMTAGTAASGITFEIGSSLTESVANLASQLNSLASNTSYMNSIGAAKYTASGTTLNIAARAGGSLSNNFTTKAVDAQAAVAANGIATTNASAAVVVTTSAAHGYAVGQEVRISGVAAAGVGSITAAQMYGTITAVTSTTFTFTSQGTAGSTTTGGTGSVAQRNSAAFTTEANISGGFAGSSFNLFSVTTGLTTKTTAVSADTAATGTPFQNGDSLQATVNGVTKTLYTFGSASDGGAYTLQNIVDGINATSDSTGISADFVYSSGTYNIRLNYEGLGSNILIDAGNAYHSGTYTLSGSNIDDSISATLPVEATGTNTLRRSLINTGYLTVVDSGDILTGGTTAATVTATTPSADTAPFRIGDNLTVNVNGSDIVLHTFATSDGLDDIVNSINDKTADTGVYATITGTANNYNMRLYLTDPSAGYVTVNAGTGLYTGGAIAANTNNTVSGTASLTQTSTYGLSGGANDGLSQGSVAATGTIGDNILTTLSQEKANVSLIYTQNAVATNTLVVGGVTFTYTANTDAAPNEILIGSTLSETLDNTVETINAYLLDGHALGDAAYQLNQLDIRRSGNNLTFTGTGLANVTKLDGTNASISQTVTGASITNSGNLSNAATTYGVDVTGVTNADFKGTISGFTSTYKNSADTVDLSVQIGDYTYTAENVDMTVASNTRIRLYSNTAEDGSTGGYFDVQLQAAKVTTFNTQSGADAVASRLNAAFSSLTFYQERNITSYTGSDSITANGTVIGSLLDTKFTSQLGNFDDLELTDIAVTAPSGSSTDAKITFTIGGTEFSTATGLTGNLGAHQTFRLTSSDNPNEFIEFTTGGLAIDLATQVKADAFEDALKSAFGINDGAAALQFQVGTSTVDTLSVSINDARTNKLYAGASLNVLTQESAAEAVTALDLAIQNITAVRANVGALQSRFNFAAANIESSIQNQDAARGTLLDADIADESTVYATNQVKLQAGISVLAQANQQMQSLLKLIG